jgi:DNA polymerase III gamma/tau subunit
LEIETLPPIILVKHFCKAAGYPSIQIDPAANILFLSLAQTPTELRNITMTLCNIYGAKDPNAIISAENILDLFAAPSFSLCLALLKAYVKKDKEAIMQIFLTIWKTGISYEDFLHELTSSIHQLGILDPHVSQEIHQLILKKYCF